MTVLERLKAAGYDPAVSLFPDSIGNIKASRLILVVEVEAGNAAAVEHRAACLRELLRPVNVAECYEVKVCGFQGGRVDDGLKLCK